LGSPGPGIRAAALAVVDSLGRSFRSDLRLTDRVYWQQTVTNWGEGLGGPSGPAHVLYSGPLESYRSRIGPPDFSPTIRAGCGNRIARDTWMIVTGHVSEPALQGQYLLLDRRGHVLLWYVE
jgi:hypothetical protein